MSEEKITTATEEQWAQIEKIKEECIRKQTDQYTLEQVRDVQKRMWAQLKVSRTPLIIQAPSPHRMVLWTVAIKLLIDERKAAGSELNEDELTPEFLNAAVERFKAQDPGGFKKACCDEPKYVGVFWRVWAGWYTGAEVLGVKFDQDKLNLFRDWADRVAAWCAYEGLLVVSHNPIKIHYENGRLHNTSGQSVEFADGWGIYTIGGVGVDEQIVMRPETQTLAQIRDETNAEIKRIRIERYGWQRYIEEMNAEVLDERFNEVEQTKEALFRMSDGIVSLVCHCPSTGKVFAMEVGPEVTTCQQAQDWLRNEPGQPIGAS